MEQASLENWHVAKDGNESGPFSWDDVVKKANDGWLKANDLIWTPGMSEWIRSGNVKGLFVPPPLPDGIKDITKNIGSTSSPTPLDGPVGLDGWLLLIGFGLLISPLLALIRIAEVFMSSSVLFFGLALAESIVTLMIGVICHIWLFMLFLRKKRNFPESYSQVLWLGFIVFIIDLVVSFHIISSQIQLRLRILLSCATSSLCHSRPSDSYNLDAIHKAITTREKYLCLLADIAFI
jgi:hypothetical protein